MNAIPARVAGVERLVVCAPTPDGAVNPLVLLAARLAGVDDRLPHRRRPGDRRARLRHRDDRAGRQDHRPRQRLGGGGQAPGLRPRRHRHDRRPLRGAGDRRRRRTTPTGWRSTCSPRPSTTPSAQAMLITDDAGFGRAVAARGRGAARHPRRAATSPARAGATSARSSRCATGTRRWRSPTASRPSTCRSAPPTPRTLAPRVRHAGAIFIGALTPGGDRRLRRRPEPRAADRALGALLLRALGARLHEAHHHRPHDPGRARRHRAGGGAPGRAPRGSRRTALSVARAPRPAERGLSRCRARPTA